MTANQLMADAGLYFDVRYRTGPALIGFLVWNMVKRDLPSVVWIAKHRLQSVVATVAATPWSRDDSPQQRAAQRVETRAIFIDNQFTWTLRISQESDSSLFTLSARYF